MRNGSYSLALAADGIADEGQLQLKEETLLGSTSRFRLSGQVVQSGEGRLSADVLVTPTTPSTTSLPIADDEVISLAGRSDDGSFYLRGEGRSGVLIEIGCHWRSNYLDGLGDR